MDLVRRLRQHALPDPHDEREVLHAPLLRDAADEIERLRTLLQRGQKQIMAWATKYGEHNPRWLPPAGDMEWLMDVDDELRPNG